MEEELKIDVTTDVDKEWVRNYILNALTDSVWPLKQTVDILNLNLEAARAQERLLNQEVASLKTRISRLENPPRHVSNFKGKV